MSAGQHSCQWDSWENQCVNSAGLDKSPQCQMSASQSASSRLNCRLAHTPTVLKRNAFKITWNSPWWTLTLNRLHERYILRIDQVSSRVSQWGGTTCEQHRIEIAKPNRILRKSRAASPLTQFFQQYCFAPSAPEFFRQGQPSSTSSEPTQARSGIWIMIIVVTFATEERTHKHSLLQKDCYLERN